MKNQERWLWTTCLEIQSFDLGSSEGRPWGKGRQAAPLLGTEKDKWGNEGTNKGWLPRCKPDQPLLSSTTSGLLSQEHPVRGHINDRDWRQPILVGIQGRRRFPWRFSGKESTCQCRGLGFNPWIGKIPCRRKWQPTPVFLPGESHGQRSLVGYSWWGYRRVRHELATKQ